MEHNRGFTKEELERAKSVDLTAVASTLGYTVCRIGQYHTLKEMDSIRIYNRSHWFRWSRAGMTGENGGSQIDFLRVFLGLDVKEAVAWLLEFAFFYGEVGAEYKWKKETQKQSKEESKRIFLLPEPAINNQKLYSYLMDERGLSKEVVDYFIQKGLLYESKEYHNVVFLGKDRHGATKFASQRGIRDYKGKAFKCDVRGNDKHYGFNVRNSDSDELFVFEGAIDLMSYVELSKDYESNKLALGMTADMPLERFLEESSQIQKLHFCLDRDTAGIQATEQLMEKYKGKGYQVFNQLPPVGVKDYNELLQNRSGMKKQYHI